MKKNDRMNEFSPNPSCKQELLCVGFGCLFPGLPTTIDGVNSLIEQNIATIPLHIAGKHGSLYSSDPAYLPLNLCRARG